MNISTGYPIDPFIGESAVGQASEVSVCSLMDVYPWTKDRRGGNVSYTLNLDVHRPTLVQWENACTAIPQYISFYYQGCSLYEQK